jgi:hypothetical protein
MRSALLVAILVSTSAFLAGCSDDGGHEHEAYTCPDGTELDLEQFPDHDNATFNPLSKCPKKGGSSGTNTTGSAPNVLPTLVLTVTDDGGNATPVTMLNGNLTFSAEGSKDSDGTITGIAVSVTDSNTTRTATLFDPATKAFKSATFKFDRPGVVNVTVAMVDDRAGFTVNQSKVYVNHLQVVNGGVIQAPFGSQVPEMSDPCTGGEDLLDAAYFKVVSFAVYPGVTRIDATATVSTNEMTICDAMDVPVSDEKVAGTVSTKPDAVLAPPAGITSYKVGVYSGAPAQGGASTETTVLVHYEPQAAAPAV